MTLTVQGKHGKNVCQHLIARIAVAACLTFPARGLGQERIEPMAATVAQSFRMIEQSFVGLADAMPAEKYSLKPTNGEFKDVRTFGEQVKHVACNNFAFFNEIEKKEPPYRCGAGGWTVRRHEHALRTHDPRGLARVRSLRSTCRVPPYEWDRAASEPARAVTMSGNRIVCRR